MPTPKKFLKLIADLDALTQQRDAMSEHDVDLAARAQVDREIERVQKQIDLVVGRARTLHPQKPSKSTPTRKPAVKGPRFARRDRARAKEPDSK